MDTDKMVSQPLTAFLPVLPRPSWWKDQMLDVNTAPPRAGSTKSVPSPFTGSHLLFSNEISPGSINSVIVREDPSNAIDLSVSLAVNDQNT